MRVALSLVLLGLALSSAAQRDTLQKPQAVLLPIKSELSLIGELQSGMSDSLWARGALIQAFRERGMPFVSPVQISTTGEELKLDLEKPETWTEPHLAAIGKRWKVRYVATLILRKLEIKDEVIRSQDGKIAPGAKTTINGLATGSLYDVKTGKYIFQDKDTELKEEVGRAGANSPDPKLQRLGAIDRLAREVFKDFLSKFPKVQPPKKGGKG